MILNAKYKNQKEMRKINTADMLIETPRGALTHSLRFLATTWGWSKSKVERFLAWLEDDQMIERKSGQKVGQTIICNYDAYQNPRDKCDDKRGTTKGQLRDNNKEVKEIKEKYSANSQEMKLTIFAIEKIKINHPHIDFDQNDKQKICKMFNMLISRDQFSPEQIHDVIKWVTEQTERNNNGFCWADQFQSPMKLRSKNKEGIKYIDVWLSEVNRKNLDGLCTVKNRVLCPNCNSENTSWSIEDKFGNKQEYICIDCNQDFKTGDKKNGQ